MTAPTTETSMDRAVEAAAILLKVGENWVPRLPHDAALRGIATGDDLYVLLGGVRMRRVTEPDESGHSQAWWELTENGRGRTVVPPAPELERLREWGLAR